jgi:hypothetical protein
MAAGSVVAATLACGGGKEAGGGRTDLRCCTVSRGVNHVHANPLVLACSSDQRARTFTVETLGRLQAAQTAGTVASNRAAATASTTLMNAADGNLSLGSWKPGTRFEPS